MTSRLFRDTKHSILYSKFRPSPPDDFIKSIIKYVKETIKSPLTQAVDIGCGSGQSTVAIAPYFERVTGIDISEAQIEAAKKDRSLHNINYIVEDCYKLPVPNESVQLVTLSQSVHWFDTNKLFSEVKRVLMQTGVIAAFGYWIPFPQVRDEKKTAIIQKLISEDLHEKQLGKYWNKERYIVQNKYFNLDFPFQEVQRLKKIQKSESTLAGYLNYLCTWSAYQKLVKENNIKAQTMIKDVENQLINILDPGKAAEDIVFQLNTEFFLLMGHK